MQAPEEILDSGQRLNRRASLLVFENRRIARGLPGLPPSQDHIDFRVTEIV